MVRYNYFLALLVAFIIAASGCSHPATVEATPEVRVPVTVVHISKETMQDSITLMGTSVFLKKNTVRSTVAGYLDVVDVKVGDFVTEGQTLFRFKTKEAAAFHSKVLDTILNFDGKITIAAPSSGYVTEVLKQKGDYATDGDPLCTIAQTNSLVFMLHIPYALSKYAKQGSQCTVILPDKSELPAVIDTRMSVVDTASQSLVYTIRVIGKSTLPENLIAGIRIAKTANHVAVTLPKGALLTDEKEENFWVMKLINDSTAVKVPVEIGMESSVKVEILSPAFLATDRLVSSGNYGLPDTASVSVTKPGSHE